MTWNQWIGHAREPALLQMNVSAANFGEFYLEKRRVELEFRLRDFAYFNWCVGVGYYGDEWHLAENS